MSPRHPSLPPALRLRARGALANETGRFESERREAFHDGWDLPEEERLLRTEVRTERPRSALTWNRSPDLPFDRSINPYRGCEHGCIYCFARPTHAYLNLSPGLDFETRLIARPGIAAVLERELRSRSYRVAPVALGTNTDPYQPIESTHRLMREILEVLRDFRHPTAITTKGTLIERDLDLLAPMAADGLLRVGISVTTLDPDLSRRLEPRAPPPARRLQTIRRLTGAGIPVRAMIAPVIPGLTDPELDRIVEAVAEAGAVAASWIMLRLPLEVAPLVRAWAEDHYPGRADKMMGRIREVHGGRDYDPSWGKRMRGEGIWSDLLARRFRLATARHGLDRAQPPLRCDLFRPPPRPGDQLTLL
ncbi:PA0069 family radical SAM protein [Cereibacter azotoformans]|uniref:DNA repair photolyase n=1 Tax=Cereibacter azotoformans TaxID=43057 RepID=A0A2T5K6M8_9RHOB|nr:PA0069 family radical SAM protein [Cereibacter azotoformans]AXQ92927.1 PA0069 family radical SAM protein [Cereibacter sphaeroides]MBO4169400.1 PA0069 family radical SAM protein [Cereibacter azotoformans]PTR18077.1 DNA repair photolyase [Cereibacter azotoformans]UIJ31216.1 PA0069 family radical SAM protein [Cereibacter azotoformans]